MKNTFCVMHQNKIGKVKYNFFTSAFHIRFNLKKGEQLLKNEVYVSTSIVNYGYLSHCSIDSFLRTIEYKKNRRIIPVVLTLGGKKRNRANKNAINFMILSFEFFCIMLRCMIFSMA